MAKKSTKQKKAEQLAKRMGIDSSKLPERNMPSNKALGITKKLAGASHLRVSPDKYEEALEMLKDLRDVLPDLIVEIDEHLPEGQVCIDRRIKHVDTTEDEPKEKPLIIDEEQGIDPALFDKLGIEMAEGQKELKASLEQTRSQDEQTGDEDAE